MQVPATRPQGRSGGQQAARPLASSDARPQGRPKPEVWAGEPASVCEPGGGPRRAGRPGGRWLNNRRWSAVLLFGSSRSGRLADALLFASRNRIHTHYWLLSFFPWEGGLTGDPRSGATGGPHGGGPARRVGGLLPPAAGGNKKTQQRRARCPTLTAKDSRKKRAFTTKQDVGTANVPGSASSRSGRTFASRDRYRRNELAKRADVPG